MLSSETLNFTEYYNLCFVWHSILRLGGSTDIFSKKRQPHFRSLKIVSVEDNPLLEA
jgi:hypothetical protein